MPNYFLRDGMGAVVLADNFERYERQGRQVAGAVEIVSTISLPGELLGRGPAERDGVGRLVLPEHGDRGLTAGELVVFEGLSRISAWTNGARGQVASAGVTIRCEKARPARSDEALHEGLLPVRGDWSVARLTRVTRGDRDAATDYPVTATVLLSYSPNEDGRARPTETLEIRCSHVLEGCRPGSAVELVDMRVGYTTVDKDDSRLGIGARKSSLSVFAAAVAPVGSHSPAPAHRGRKTPEPVTVPAADAAPSEG